MKDILVHLNDESAVNNRIYAAKSIGSRFNAHITGLYVDQAISHESYGTFLQADIFNEYEQRQKQHALSARRMFTDATSDYKDDTSILECIGESSEQLIKYAGSHDLVVVSKFDQNSHYEHLKPMATRLVLGSGRPVIMVPELDEGVLVGKSVLVAWNGTPEAARALHDSMPILQTADYVNVVTFSDNSEPSDVIDISAHLKRYGVIFDVVNSSSPEKEIASRLLNFVTQFDSDLLVMGAYGHSRLREYVLGGVSRTIFQEIQIPLFVSH